MPTDLVEPTAEAVQPSQIPTGAAAAASAPASADQSAIASLRAAMEGLPPSKPAPSAAQLAGGAAQETPPAAPAPEGDKASTTERTTSEGALEDFRLSLRREQRAKNREAIKAQAAPLEEPDATPAPVEKKEDPAPTAPVTPPVTPPVTAPVTPPVETDDAPVTDEEIQKTVNDPAISKRHQKRMQYLANKAKELETKLVAAEAKPKTDATEEKLKAVEEQKNLTEQELIRYRRRYSLESEPELKQLDEIAVKADEAIYGKLKEAGLSDVTVKLIKDMGGFDGFSRSNQTFKINVKDADGEIVEQQISAGNLAKKWLGDMLVGDSEYIRAKLSERYNAADTKKRRAEEMSKDAETWFKGVQEQQTKQAEHYQNTATEYRSNYQKKFDEWTGKQEALKDKVPAPTASETERKEIEEYNKNNVEVKNLIKMAMAPTTLDEHVSVVREAANSIIYKRDISRLERELASAKQQLEKVGRGTSTTGKPGGGALARVAPPKPDTSTAAMLRVPAAESLRDAMERLRDNANE